MPARLPLTALRAFEAAARNGSLTAAATELGVTRPAISKQIKQLEQINSDIRFNTENIMKEKDKQINKQQEEISNLSLES